MTHSFNGNILSRRKIRSYDSFFIISLIAKKVRELRIHYMDYDPYLKFTKYYKKGTTYPFEVMQPIIEVMDKPVLLSDWKFPHDTPYSMMIQVSSGSHVRFSDVHEARETYDVTHTLYHSLKKKISGLEVLFDDEQQYYSSNEFRKLLQ